MKTPTQKKKRLTYKEVEVLKDNLKDNLKNDFEFWAITFFILFIFFFIIGLLESNSIQNLQDQKTQLKEQINNIYGTYCQGNVSSVWVLDNSRVYGCEINFKKTELGIFPIINVTDCKILP